MARIWPLLILGAILFFCGARLVALERSLTRFERATSTRGGGEEGRELAFLRSLATLLPRALTKIAYFSGVGLGLGTLSAAIARGESPLLGALCIGVGVSAAVALSAWGRRLQGRVRVQRQRPSSEFGVPDGKV